MSRPLPTQGPVVLTVSQLTHGIRGVLHERFDDVWVRGEIGNFKRHQPSGHLYFHLKDETALLSCVMWRMAASGLRFSAADGIEIEARGSVDVYPRQGRYQLVVREMVPGGRGALLLALEQLRRKLAAEGLFAAERKRPLPRFPRRIALVTSPSGAAVRDLVNGLTRRWPLAELVLVPVPVQGEGAAEAIAAAIRQVHERNAAEMMIVARGGGSLEDLWAFNEEVLVRAVAGSAIPVVSAVGHEVDHTLCDDAADVRAATPSAAAEIATPDGRQVALQVAQAAARSGAAMTRLLEHGHRRLRQARRAYGFRRPQDLLGNWGQEVDRLHARLSRAVGLDLARRRDRVRRLAEAYRSRRPERWIRRLAENVMACRFELDATLSRLLSRRGTSWRSVARQLQALSPRAVLGRGYSLVRLPDGRLVRSWLETPAGTTLALEYADGGARARVESSQGPATRTRSATMLTPSGGDGHGA